MCVPNKNVISLLSPGISVDTDSAPICLLNDNPRASQLDMHCCEAFHTSLSLLFLNATQRERDGGRDGGQKERDLSMTCLRNCNIPHSCLSTTHTPPRHYRTHASIMHASLSPTSFFLPLAFSLFSHTSFCIPLSFFCIFSLSIRELRNKYTRLSYLSCRGGTVVTLELPQGKISCRK